MRGSVIASVGKASLQGGAGDELRSAVVARETQDFAASLARDRQRLPTRRERRRVQNAELGMFLGEKFPGCGVEQPP